LHSSNTHTVNSTAAASLNQQAAAAAFNPCQGENPMKKQLILAGLLSVLAVSSFAEPAAATPAQRAEWAKTHPRRAEVNARLRHQNRRIHQEVKEGELTHGQAAALHQEDHQIRQEERDMAAQNGGHITRQEQKTLNQQENQVNRQIGH
jgi:hypothetical protein